MKKYLSLLKKRSFKGPASVWKRLFAFIIDLLIVDFVCGYPFRRILNKLVPKGSYIEVYRFLLDNPGLKDLLVLMSIALGVMAMLYFAVLEYFTGQTIGKILASIRVESDTDRLHFWQCLVSNLFLVPVFPLILLWIIDPVWLLYTKGKKRLSDVFARTKVTEEYTF